MPIIKRYTDKNSSPRIILDISFDSIWAIRRLIDYALDGTLDNENFVFPYLDPEEKENFKKVLQEITEENIINEGLNDAS